MTSVLHVSDLHFGKPSIPEQIAAIEQLIQRERFDVVALSGDVSQRARRTELARGRKFLRDAARVSETIVVPGNHDVKWWRAPFGVGSPRAAFAAYREFIQEDLESVLRVPGVTLVGINTAHGVRAHTLTWNPRDIGVVGDLQPSQIERARTIFAQVPKTDARVIVMHHNPLKGALSRRYGLAHHRRAVDAFAELHVDIVLCGHDHQEAVDYVEHTERGTVVSTAGTPSRRSRGKRPGSVNVITISPAEIVVETRLWSSGDHELVTGPIHRFTR